MFGRIRSKPYEMRRNRQRGDYPKAKPWKGEGPGVFEVVADFAGDTFRAVYTVRFQQALYVLPAFQKKSMDFRSSG
jgi:phage-related protein